MTDTSPDMTDSQWVQTQIEHMDTLLVAGKAAVAKLDQFYQDHGLQPGFGAKNLQGEDVPERHRIIFARILAELPVIDQRVDEMNPHSPKPAPVPVGTRAVGNRYRI